MVLQKDQKMQESVTFVIVILFVLNSCILFLSQHEMLNTDTTIYYKNTRKARCKQWYISYVYMTHFTKGCQNLHGQGHLHLF